MLHSTDTDVDGMNAGKAMAALDSIAVSIANVFNNLNTRPGAYAIDPDNTGQLITTSPDNFIFGEPKEAIDPDTGDTIYILEGVTADNISLNSNLLTDDGIWNIACAYSDDPNYLNDNLNAVGNAQNVVAMLGTRNQKIEELGNTSIEDFYTNLLGKIAAGGSNMKALVETQTSVVDSIKNKMLSNNSVDINEELVDLVKYQTAYSAAAKVFTTCNSCLDTLMTLGG